MNFAVMIRRTLAQFRANLLRTLLTLLGVVFGVAAVVSMVSIGEGAQQQILTMIERMGATSVHVHAKPISGSNLSDAVKDTIGLTRADARAIAATIPGVERVAWRKRHELGVTDLPVSPGDLHVYGVSEDLFVTHALRVGAGRPLSRVDHSRLSRVAVVGHTLATEAFGDAQHALGRDVRLDDAYFTIVGVLQAQDPIGASADTAASGSDDAEDGTGAGLEWQNYEAAVLIPFETMLLELRPPHIYGELDSISVDLPSTEQTLTGKQAVISLLTDLHGGRRDFDVVAPEEILRQKQATQAVFNMVLVAIAAISLIVGGIGVMNIMLANIMERISEIGLRRAVGARRRDIRNQFLLESIVICVIGGILGIALGFAISVGVSMVVGLPIAFAWESMVVSFAISLIVGITFGLWPAIRAANVNPIEALRGE